MLKKRIPKYKVGDTVQIVKELDCPTNKIGSVFKIEEVWIDPNESDASYRRIIYFFEGVQDGNYEDEVELHTKEATTC